MSESLKARIRQKLLRQLDQDGKRPIAKAEHDDQRLNELQYDLAALDRAAEGDQLIEDLAAKYWVP